MPNTPTQTHTQTLAKTAKPYGADFCYCNPHYPLAYSRRQCSPIGCYPSSFFILYIALLFIDIESTPTNDCEHTRNLVYYM